MQNQEEIDFNTEELDTDELLQYAGYYTYKAISFRIPEDIIYNFERSRELYYGMKFSISADSKKGSLGPTGNESVDKVIEAAMKNMYAHHRVVIDEEKKYLKHQETFFTYARQAFQEAVEASNTRAEFEKCASAIALQLNDKEWADEIRKQAYGNDWIPNEKEETNILDTESTHNEYMKLTETLKGDLVKYFKQRQPASYGEYTD